MNDIIDEVKSDLQEERVSKIISKYGKHILCISFLILVSVGIFVYISNSKIDKHEQLSKAYFEFQQSDKKILPETIKKSSQNIYTDLANLDHAIALKDSGKYKDSLLRFMDVVNKTSHKEIKNLAAIHSGLLVLEHGDKKNKDLFLSKVENSTIKEEEPFGELLNWIVYQIKSSEPSSARKQEIMKILKNSDSKSQNIKLMNDILINSIKNK